MSNRPHQKKTGKGGGGVNSCAREGLAVPAPCKTSIMLHKVNTLTPLYVTSTNNIYRTRAATPPPLQTNGGKDELNIVFLWKS